MFLEEALRIELNAIPQLTNKIFPLVAIEGSKPPYVVYISSEGLQYKSLDGFYVLKTINFDIHVVHTSYSQLKALTKLVLDKIISFENTTIGGANGVVIGEISYDMPLEFYEHEANLYRSFFEFRVKL